MAGLLSFFAPGLGHIYSGRFSKGLVLFFAGTALGFPGMLGILPIGLGYRVAGIVAIIAGAVIWVYAILDARRTAGKASPDYALRDYNRWWVYLILVLLPLPISMGGAMLIREGLLEAFYVPSRSMYPTIRFGDRVLANKITYRSQPVRRGDIIVFANPNQRNQNYIKRVVALPGDRARIENNRLFINGSELKVSEIGTSAAGEDKQLAGMILEETNGSAAYRILLAPPAGTQPSDDQAAKGRSFEEITVATGHCFVLGDNRNRSHDSREFGPVPLGDVIGRVNYMYFPRWANLNPHRGK